MNAKIAIVTTLIAFAGAGSAFAQEATADQFAQPVASQKTRAEVNAETIAAQRAGVSLGGTWQFKDVKSVRSRAEVQAEARAAQALGIQTQRLHYQIRGLEAALGTPLFSVGNPSWLPTSTGVKALPKIMAMLRIWEQIEPRPSAGRTPRTAK